MSETKQHPQRLDGLIWREVDDGIVIVSPTAGKVRVLNKVGSAIWELLDGDHTPATIQSNLCNQFSQVPPEQINQDIQTFLDDLTNRGLIVWR